MCKGVKTWIKKWDSPADVERNMKDISPAPLRSSAKNNTIYKDFRWIFISRDSEPPAEIESTIIRRHKSPEVHFIAMIATLPEKYTPNSGKQVQQIDPKTNKVLKIYASNREICKLFQMSVTKLKDVLKNNEIHQGFRWQSIEFSKCEQF